MSTKIRHIPVLLIAVMGAFLAVGSFAQSSMTALATGAITAQQQIEMAQGVSQVNAFGLGLSASIPGCESSGTGQVGCMGLVSGGSGQYNYWWLWDGPGHLYQDNTDYVSIFDCLDGEGDLTLKVFDRETWELGESSPLTVMCDCSPGNDACEIDIFGEEPCWPELGFCG